MRSHKMTALRIYNLFRGLSFSDEGKRMLVEDIERVLDRRAFPWTYNQDLDIIQAWITLWFPGFTNVLLEPRTTEELGDLMKSGVEHGIIRPDKLNDGTIVFRYSEGKTEEDLMRTPAGKQTIDYIQLLYGNEICVPVMPRTENGNEAHERFLRANGLPNTRPMNAKLEALTYEELGEIAAATHTGVQIIERLKRTDP